MTRDEFWKYMYSRCLYNINRLGWDQNLIYAVVAQAAGESGYAASTLSKNYFNFWGMKSGWQGADYYISLSGSKWCAFNTKNNGIDFYFDKLENSAIYSDAKSQTDPYDYITYLSSNGWNGDEGVESYQALIFPIIEYYSGLEPPDPSEPLPDDPSKDLTPRDILLLKKRKRIY